jgi:hypothetical protein
MSVSKLFTPKPFTNLAASKIGALTQWIEVTALELLNKIKKEEEEKHRKPGEEENCPICMCELYDDLEKKP